MNNFSKPIKITFIIIVALLILGFVYWLGTNNQKKVLPVVPSKILETQSPAAAKATKKLVDEVSGTNDQNVETIITSTVGADGKVTTTSIKVVAVAGGTSPIDIESGRVLTRDGSTTTNSVAPGTLNAPRQSYPLNSTSSLPSSTIKLNVTSKNFTPNKFTVNQGQAVSLAITNVNQTTLSEIFRFDDPSLSSIAVGVVKGQTGVITFNAPTKAGNYVFYSSMFNHRALGAVGTMTVK